MKVTWFSQDAFRVQLGGKILVLYPDHAVGVQRRDLLSGADMVVSGTEGLDRIDLVDWRPGRRSPTVEGNDIGTVAAYTTDAGILLTASGEPPLLLLREVPNRLGRWVNDAVVIPLGPDPQRAVEAILKSLSPALLLVREADATALDLEWVAKALDGTLFQVLDVGMGIEFA